MNPCLTVAAGIGFVLDLAGGIAGFLCRFVGALFDGVACFLRGVFRGAAGIFGGILGVVARVFDVLLGRILGAQKRRPYWQQKQERERERYLRDNRIIFLLSFLFIVSLIVLLKVLSPVFSLRNEGGRLIFIVVGILRGEICLLHLRPDVFPCKLNGHASRTSNADSPQETTRNLAPIISAQGLSKRYGIAPLFQNISFTVSEGDRIGLIGPNGSGKSTLLAILYGRVKPDTGEVAVRKGTRLSCVAQVSNLRPARRFAR